jgi:hypothetical protein
MNTVIKEGYRVQRRILNALEKLSLEQATYLLRLANVLDSRHKEALVVELVKRDDLDYKFKIKVLGDLQDLGFNLEVTEI